jgi:hypothetical protein
MANQSKIIATWQVRLIHVAANQLHLIWKKKELNGKDEIEDPYHQILSGFNDKDGKPAISCKSLNYDQAAILLDIFNNLGFKSNRPRSNQFESLFSKSRPAQYASVAQLGMLMGMWVDNSREKTLSSLDQFTNKIVHISHIEWLLKIHVPKMVEAIKNL